MPGTYEQVNRLLSSTSTDQLKIWWNGNDVPEWVAQDHIGLFYDQLAFYLLKLCGKSYLRPFLWDSYIPRRCAVLYWLSMWDRNDSEINQEVQQALQEAFASENKYLKYKGLFGLTYSGQFVIERDVIVQLMDDPNDWIATVAMVYLSRAYPDEAVDILRTALHSENPRMRQHACFEIDSQNIGVLKSELPRFLSDADERVRRAASSSLGIYEE